MKRTTLVAIAFVVVLACGGLFALSMMTTPANPPVKAEPPWDAPQTRALFMQSCGDCHSNETTWPWYSRIPPVSILVERDVREGRQKFNVSEWGTARRETGDAAETIQRGSMPPTIYVIMHPDAKLTPADTQSLLKGMTATFGAGRGSR